MFAKKDLNLLEETKKMYTEHPYDVISSDLISSQYKSTGLKVSELAESLEIDNPLIVDVGCGVGWTLGLFCNNPRFQRLGIDISLSALKIAKDKYDFHLINASNMQIPLRDEIVDVVISLGVIHHTPNPYKSFKELVRILKRGGLCYLMIYDRNIYYFIYTYFGGPLRFFLRHFPSIKIVYRVVFLPVFYAFIRLRSIIILRNFKKNKSYQQAWNQFHDLLLTPQAKFYTKEEMLSWFLKNSIECFEHTQGIFGHIFLLRKK